MVIRTIDTNLIRHYAKSSRLGATARLAAVGRNCHSPQDPQCRRGSGPALRLSVKEQMQQDELASLRQLRCDVKLLSGDLDHDIAILNIVA
ncbi:MAG: hypothetical protein H8E91_02880 [Planctomycetes bacterium]|nr:hypothetical protein [Planctomycetota bacterium]